MNTSLPSTRVQVFDVTTSFSESRQGLSAQSEASVDESSASTSLGLPHEPHRYIAGTWRPFGLTMFRLCSRLVHSTSSRDDIFHTDRMSLPRRRPEEGRHMSRHYTHSSHANGRSGGSIMNIRTLALLFVLVLDIVLFSRPAAAIPPAPTPLEPVNGASVLVPSTKIGRAHV